MYSLTFISHGTEFQREDVQLMEILVSELAVSVSGKRELSKNRVFDYEVQSSNPDLIKTLLVKKRDQALPFDIFFQKASERKNKKLFIFDMDSTLIYQEVIELIAAYADIEDKVAEITERAMNGELDFNDSLRERVALLKGIDSSTLWEELKGKITITKGARTLCKALAKMGAVMGVCSGGFIPLATYVKEELGLHYAYANTLGVDDTMKLDGTTVGYTVNGEKKAQLLLEIAANHGLDPVNAVAVGDGANDLPMMAVAGWGVAWNAKPKVQKEAPCCLNTESLRDILYIMGLDDQQIESLAS